MLNRDERGAPPAQGRPDATLGDPVLDVAARLFDTVGWERTTVERVATEAGAPLAGVLLRFPSRDHLAAGIVQQVLNRLPEEFSDEIEAGAPLAERLYVILANELRMLEPHKGFVRQALPHVFSPLSPSMVLQAPLAARYVTYVAEQIEVARERREVRSWIIPSLAAGAFWLLQARVIAHWLSDRSPGSERTHAQADRWIRDFVRSLGGRAARPPPPARAEAEAGPPPVPRSASPSMLLEGELEGRPTGAFAIENRFRETIAVSVKATAFVSPAGDAIAPSLSFEPRAVSLAGGEQAIIHVTATITDELEVGVDYQGELTVAEMPGTRIPVVLRRRPSSAARVAAPARLDKRRKGVNGGKGRPRPS